MRPVTAIPGVKFVLRMWASARGATYRSEAELSKEVATRLPDPSELQTIADIDVQVRSKASPPWLSEFLSRQVLASLQIELVDEAPPYDIIRLQSRLHNSGIPVVQVFSKRAVNKGDLGINELLLYSSRNDSSFEVLLELGADIGEVERWVRDLDAELLDHLREVGNDASGDDDLSLYDHGERIATSVTVHPNRSSRTVPLIRLLSRVDDEVGSVTVFRRCEPEWYLERVGGSDSSSDVIMTVSHRIRINDEWRSGIETHEEVFKDTEAALRWLNDFLDNPPERIEPRESVY